MRARHLPLNHRAARADAHLIKYFQPEADASLIRHASLRHATAPERPLYYEAGRRYENLRPGSRAECLPPAAGHAYHCRLFFEVILS